jgi:DNA-binding NarL/FixJ family response regulator
MRTKVLIVDDHPLVRESLAARINGQHDMCVCGEAGSIRQARDKVAECSPEVAIIDLSLGDGSGLDLIQYLSARYPALRLLVLSMYDERIFAPRVLQAGASGYLMKQVATEKIIEAIQAIRHGNVFLSDAIRQRMLNGLAVGNRFPPTGVDVLTNRELEVYRLLGEGVRTRDIAATLHLSVKTIETYCERMKTRLMIESHNELLRSATIWVHAQQKE